MKCTFCTSTVEPERLDFGLSTCLSCAQKGRGQERRLGLMIYSHKTAGEIAIFKSEPSFRSFKRMDAMRGRGAGFTAAAGKAIEREMARS